jgi:hypothetical protein
MVPANTPKDTHPDVPPSDSGYLEEIVRLYEVWLGHLIFQTEEIRETIEKNLAAL